MLNEDLVNLPNWLVLKLRIEGEDAIRLDNVELLDYRHDLRHRDTRWSSRELRFRDRAGRETTLRSRRFVRMAHVHQARDRVDAHRRRTGRARSRSSPRSTAA